jgi:hypothetical protein
MEEEKEGTGSETNLREYFIATICPSCALPHLKTASLTGSLVASHKRRWPCPAAPDLPFLLFMKQKTTLFVGRREAENR